MSKTNGHTSLSVDELDTLSLVAEPPKPRGKLLHADELGTLPRPSWLIPGVLPTNQISQIFGRPGSGKSHLNLDIALSVAQYANVVYIAAEDAEVYRERVPAWCEQHDLGTGKLHFWPEPVNLLNPESVALFLEEVTPLRPALIVMDTLANCMVGADENSTKDMGQAIDAMNHIRRQTRAAILVCHHTGWADQHERGNSALRGACRLVMKLSQSDDGLMTLTCEKANGSKEFEPRYFRLIPKAESVAIVPSSKITTRDSALTDKHYEILEALTMAVFAGGATHTQLVEHSGMPKSTVNKALSKLMGMNYVEADGGRYKQYTITSTGRANLQAHFYSTAGGNSPGVHPEFTGTSELGLNWAVTLPEESGGEFTNGHADIPHSNAIVHPVHPEFTDSSQPRSCSLHRPPPLKGDGVNSGHGEQANGEEEAR